jgi:osmoprotectant transport system ATP-binding protein
VALVGESGAGKTTLLRCFNRMVVPEEGRITVGGRDITSGPPHQLRRRLGYVPQHGGLMPHWKVLRNVALVPRLLGMPDAEERARAALDRTGLAPEEFADRWPRSLSGGQRQRVALARALAADPGVLLLDEPFGALDAITRAEIQESFAKLRKELKVTTLLVTHDLREAFLLADTVVVLQGGRILVADTPEGLREDPRDGYVHALLVHAGVVQE